MEWYGEGQQERAREERRKGGSEGQGEREREGGRRKAALLWVTVAGMRVLPS